MKKLAAAVIWTCGRQGSNCTSLMTTCNYWYAINRITVNNRTTCNYIHYGDYTHYGDYIHYGDYTHYGEYIHITVITLITVIILPLYIHPLWWFMTSLQWLTYCIVLVLSLSRYTLHAWAHYRYLMCCLMLFHRYYKLPYSAKFSRHLYFVDWPLKAFRCTMFVEWLLTGSHAFKSLHVIADKR